MSVQRPKQVTPQRKARTARAGAAGPPAAKPVSEPRRPQQERGQRRVEAILDAAAAIIGEEGVSAATMHAIARRSQTTVGSMYHFFPDRDAVLLALLDRHARAVSELASQLAALDWSRLSLEEVVERFVDPLMAYAVEHPDVLPVIHTVEAFNLQEVRRTAPESLMFQLAESIVAGRTPEAPRAERTARAATVLAVVEGVAGRMARSPIPSPTAMRRELKRLLVAYLSAFER
jgi:AcrR family transcriptional regulator